jgi:hypothetical protein
MTTGPANAESSIALNFILFNAGRHLFGVEASQIRSGSLLTDEEATSFESLVHISGEANKSRQCLTVKGKVQDYNISVEAPLELCSIQAINIYPLPKLLKVRCKMPNLQALAIVKNQLILLVELTL